MSTPNALHPIARACVMALALSFAHASRADEIPRFVVEPLWPKPLPANWILGQVSGIAVDGADHIWVIHRPLTLLDDEKGAIEDPPASKCRTPAPPVLEFAADGNLLRSWGGPGPGFDWPKNEHGTFADRDGNVRLAGNDPADHQILKFSVQKFNRVS